MPAWLQAFVQGLDGDDYWNLVFFLGASVGAAFYFSFRFLRHCRLIEDTPTSKVRSAHQGYVELEGIARLIEDTRITCPLTATDCLWWFFEVEKKVRSGKNERWDTVAKGTSEEPFYLEDDTGRCVVNPAGAEVIPALRRVWYGSSERPAGPPPAGKRFFGSGSYRYTEKLIFPETRLYALGLFQTRSFSAPEPDEAAVLRAKLAEWKEDAQRMQLLDVNKDGSVDIKEWEAARRLALMEVQRGRAERASHGGIDTLSKPGVSGQPYILSATLQKELCGNYRRNAGLCFGWFVGGGALFVAMLLARGVI